MTIEEEGKALFHRWFAEAWNKGNYEVAKEIIGETFTVHGAGGQPVQQGQDGVIGLIKEWRTAFPDGKMIIHDVIAEGDRVVARMTWEGTHEGPFYGIAPTGRKVSVTSIGIDRVENGRIVEGWGELDMLGMMRQLGQIPTPGQE
jgi:steroid delta-isomerase-like uncharacterized protein